MKLKYALTAIMLTVASATAHAENPSYYGDEKILPDSSVQIQFRLVNAHIGIVAVKNDSEKDFATIKWDCYTLDDAIM